MPPFFVAVLTCVLAAAKRRRVSIRSALRAVMLAAPLWSLASPAMAQQQDEQLWSQINVNVPVGDGVKLTLEQIARFSDRQDGLYQTEFGGLLSVRVAPHVELGGGYRWVGAHNGNTNANENRARQQIVASVGPITTRFRVDERFNPRGNEVGFRIRPLIRYNYQLNSKGWALFASHESFLIPNSTAWGQRRGYERMRNILGVTLPMGRSTAADIGYLNQYRPGRGPARGQMDHAISMQITVNLQSILSAIVPD